MKSKMPIRTTWAALLAAERIAVAGSPGSGKSTLSRVIASAAGLPYVELDSIYFESGWTPNPAFEERATRALSSARWVCDWQYSVRPLITSTCDVFVCLDIPLWLCSIRVLKRSFLRRRSGIDVWPGVRDPGVIAQLIDTRLTFWWSIRNHSTEKRLRREACTSTNRHLRLSRRNLARLIRAAPVNGTDQAR